MVGLPWATAVVLGYLRVLPGVPLQLAWSGCPGSHGDGDMRLVRQGGNRWLCANIVSMGGEPPSSDMCNGLPSCLTASYGWAQGAWGGACLVVRG